MNNQNLNFPRQYMAMMHIAPVQNKSISDSAFRLYTLLLFRCDGMGNFEDGFDPVSLATDFGYSKDEALTIWIELVTEGLVGAGWMTDAYESVATSVQDLVSAE